MEEEPEKAVKQIFPKLVKLLEEKKPELIPIYQNHYQKAISHPVLAIRYYYVSQILLAYINLSKQ